jgi:phosphoribosylformylglycinamidine (FGAM) synthase-like enzyme
MNTSAPTPIGFRNEGREVLLIGGLGYCDELRFGSTQYAKVILDDLWGLPPVLEMDFEKRVQSAIRRIVNEGYAESAHDLSDGGLAVALAECCFPNGIGATIELRSNLRPEFLMFGEAPSRILVSSATPDRIELVAQEFNVPVVRLGRTMSGRLEVRLQGSSLIQTDIESLRRPWAGALEDMLDRRR